MENNIDNTCLECGYEYTTDKYCEICGTERINYCSGTNIKDTEIYSTTPCKDPLSSEARYCSVCGASSTYYESGLLNLWDAPATIKKLKYASPYKLLTSRHSFLESLEDWLVDLDQSIAVRIEQYLHSVMYPAYRFLDGHVNNGDMKELTYIATKLTTVLLLSYLDGYNTDNVYDVQVYEEHDYPLGSLENQIKVREVLSEALQKIDSIYPDPTISKNKILKPNSLDFRITELQVNPIIKTSYFKYDLNDPIDFTHPYMTIDQMKKAIRRNFQEPRDFFIYSDSAEELIKELDEQFNAAISNSGYGGELRMPILVFPIPTGEMWDPVKYGFIVKYEANGETHVYSPVAIPSLEQNSI
ncbi:zinc ribbon domain-containing protein [Pseudolactococcus reticulitermitis]|uniref:Uncharacterized protein n=1 Tax=Pseudolactococcus reticulitermitis TaxID=2025039 RepID=A0A224X1P7_9LACT|nr:zinc ribbon domain-containing protein [Lactococcus reticulitermitis]GAX46806.1 hypothetical protein RsY01_386 [Lactococcus reticulitermitis]